MKKIKDNGLVLVLNVLVFVFFLGFIYFSYFTTKELLVLKYVDDKDYAYKFNHWELQECMDPYSYKYREMYDDPDKEVIDYNKVRKECVERVYNKSEAKKFADFKFNFIKYGLATGFFFILFIMFAAQHLSLYRKKK